MSDTVPEQETQKKDSLENQNSVDSAAVEAVQNDERANDKEVLIDIKAGGDNNETCSASKDEADGVKKVEDNNSISESLVLQLDTNDNLDGYLDKKSEDSTPAVENKDDVEKESSKQSEDAKEASKDEGVRPSNPTTDNKKDDALIDKEVSTEDKNEVGLGIDTYESEVKPLNDCAEENVAVEGDDDKGKSEEKGKSVKAAKDNSRCIWVSNIKRECKASDLKHHLSKFGKVVTAKIVTDGKIFYGYVIMDKPEDVSACIENLDGCYFEGRKIGLSNKGPDTVKETKEAPQRTSRSNSHSKSVASMSSRGRSVKLEARRKPTPTLQNKSPQSRRHRSDMVREMEMLKRKLIHEERKREERRREERVREREREEKRRLEMEFKLREARKKLEMERQAIEREKLNLIRLQRIITDEERDKLKREKDNLKKEYRNLEAGLKRHRDDGREFEPRKVMRMSSSPDKRKNFYKNDSWRYDSKMPQKSVSSRVTKEGDFKYKRNYFSPKSSKIDEEKQFCLPPPPPKLGDDFEYGRRNMKDDISGEEGGYRKMEVFNRSHRGAGIDRREERKAGYEDVRVEKKMMEKQNAHYQSNNFNERPVPVDRKSKYSSAIGDFPNGRPPFMDGKNYGKQDGQRSAGPYQPDFNSTDWKNEGTVGSRFHGQPFSGPSYGAHQNVPDYYQQSNRYDYHGRKY